jgi:hypothetical protein
MMEESEPTSFGMPPAMTSVSSQSDAPAPVYREANDLLSEAARQAFEMMRTSIEEDAARRLNAILAEIQQVLAAFRAEHRALTERIGAVGTSLEHVQSAVDALRPAGAASPGEYYGGSRASAL